MPRDATLRVGERFKWSRRRAIRGHHEIALRKRSKECEDPGQIPRHSMCAIYAYIGVVSGVNVGIYGIHGVSG